MPDANVAMTTWAKCSDPGHHLEALCLSDHSLMSKYTHFGHMREDQKNNYKHGNLFIKIVDFFLHV